MSLPLRASLLLTLLVLWCGVAITSGACATTLPPVQPVTTWPNLVISESVPNDVKLCVWRLPIASVGHEWACLTVGEIRRLARGHLAL